MVSLLPLTFGTLGKRGAGREGERGGHRLGGGIWHIQLVKYLSV